MSSMLFFQQLKTDDKFPNRAIHTVVFVFCPTRGNPFKIAKSRVSGSLIGIVYCFIVLNLFLSGGENPYIVTVKILS